MSARTDMAFASLDATLAKLSADASDRRTTKERMVNEVMRLINQHDLRTDVVQRLADTATDADRVSGLISFFNGHDDEDYFDAIEPVALAFDEVVGKLLYITGESDPDAAYWADSDYRYDQMRADADEDRLGGAA